MRRKIQNHNVRKISKRGASYSVTLPVEMVRKLKWRECQKVVFTMRGKRLTIKDWEPKLNPAKLMRNNLIG